VGIRIEDLFGATLHRAALPLLEAHFGERASHVPAFWLSRWLARHRCAVKGHVPGGAVRIRDVVATMIARHGEVRRGDVHGIHLDGPGISICIGAAAPRLDALVTTWSTESLAKVASGRLLGVLPRMSHAVQGRVTVLVVAHGESRRIRTSEVVGLEGVGYEVVEASYTWRGRDGRQLFYVTRWSGASSAAYMYPDARWRDLALEVLRSLGLEAGSGEVTFVSREGESFTIWRMASRSEARAPRVGDLPLCLCGNAQAYADSPSWESAVVAARAAVAALARQLSTEVRPRISRYPRRSGESLGT